MHEMLTQHTSVGHYSTTQAKVVRIRQEFKLFRMTGSLLGYFALAWLPFVVFEFISIMVSTEINRYIRY